MDLATHGIERSGVATSSSRQARLAYVWWMRPGWSRRCCSHSLGRRASLVALRMLLESLPWPLHHRRSLRFLCRMADWRWRNETAPLRRRQWRLWRSSPTIQRLALLPHRTGRERTPRWRWRRHCLCGLRLSRIGSCLHRLRWWHKRRRLLGHFGRRHIRVRLHSLTRAAPLRSGGAAEAFYGVGSSTCGGTCGG